MPVPTEEDIDVAVPVLGQAYTHLLNALLKDIVAALGTGVGGAGGTALATSFAPTGNLSAVNVQAALAELDSEKAPVNHTQSIGSIDGLVNALAAKVNGSLLGANSGVATLDSEGKLVASQAPAVSSAVASSTAFTPAGGISATNVQAALAELDTEKLAATARGAVNGVASLDNSGKVPVGQVPSLSASILSDPETLTNQMIEEAKTADWVFALADAARKLVVVNSSTGLTGTVPPNADVPFPLHTRIDVLRFGAGAANIAAGSGVTLLKASDRSLSVRARYEAASLWKQGTNTWVLFGSLT